MILTCVVDFVDLSDLAFLRSVKKNKFVTGFFKSLTGVEV